MATTIPPLLLSELLPPFLAHLPASFSSPQPPPTLFPLLAPIVRQRLSLLLATLSSSDTWASLLTWSSSDRARLAAHLAEQEFSLHPASGEIELGGSELKGYRREDAETLKGAVELPDWGLEVQYVWCTNDPDGEDDAWRVLDLHLLDGVLGEHSDGREWSATVDAAEEAFRKSRAEVPTRRELVANVPAATAATSLPSIYASGINTAAAEEEDDDDYWNMYDRTPARTPGPHQTGGPAQSEDSYFSSYSNVETAIESGAPTLEDAPFTPPPTAPSLSSVANCGSAAVDIPRAATQALSDSASSDPSTTASTPPTAVSSYPHQHGPTVRAKVGDGGEEALVPKLEELAALHTQGEVAVKQHISTSMKALYRLSRGVGIEREEFENIVRTELAMLAMFDEE